MQRVVPRAGTHWLQSRGHFHFSHTAAYSPWWSEGQRWPPNHQSSCSWCYITAVMKALISNRGRQCMLIMWCIDLCREMNLFSLLLVLGSDRRSSLPPGAVVWRSGGRVDLFPALSSVSLWGEINNVTAYLTPHKSVFITSFLFVLQSRKAAGFWWPVLPAAAHQQVWTLHLHNEHVAQQPSWTEAVCRREAGGWPETSQSTGQRAGRHRTWASQTCRW